jgi:uncharacterized lipoprotein NlpE involved in copper resistance
MRKEPTSGPGIEYVVSNNTESVVVKFNSFTMAALVGASLVGCSDRSQSQAADAGNHAAAAAQDAGAATATAAEDAAAASRRAADEAGRAAAKAGRKADAAADAAARTH